MLLLNIAFAIALSTSIRPPAEAITAVHDIAYAGDANDAHRLDLYLPENRHSVPLVIFIHGGAFMTGDRRDYAQIGESLAQQGIGVAIISYRLFPQSDAEGATEDAAAACAWVVRHAAQYRLDSRAVFVVGHSAGAQIAALIGTNPSYLARFGLALSAIRGVVAISGAYDVRDLSGEPDSWQRVDGHIYGESPQVRSALSPSVHIDAATPPIMLVCGLAEDLRMCDFAVDFASKLQAAGRSAHVLRVGGADHMGLLKALISRGDPLNEKLLDFLREPNNQ
ncbi:MAG: alpha/beta hydrolase [Candidatus Eremiobacteraeota bacterium]|nr:alpha/beta hydrolase [Candidatus Eremiobacteraeota bacterium]